MNVLPICLTCVPLYSQRSKKSIGTGIMNGCEPVLVLEAEP